MTRLLALALALFANISPAAEPQPLPSPLWFAARVQIDRGGGVTAMGSGTPIASEGGKTLILTNAHVLPKHDSDKPITVIVLGKKYVGRYVDGSAVTATGGNTIHVDGPDLAVIQVDAELGSVHFAEKLPAAGDGVWQWGYGQGTTPTGRHGTVRAVEYTEPHLSATLSPEQGDSGAGVFDTNGFLVGVCWGGEPGRLMAVPVTTCRTFLAVRHPLLRQAFPRLAEFIRPTFPALPLLVPVPMTPAVVPPPFREPKIAPKVEAPKEPVAAPVAAPACPTCRQAPMMIPFIETAPRPWIQVRGRALPNLPSGLPR